MIRFKDNEGNEYTFGIIGGNKPPEYVYNGKKSISKTTKFITKDKNTIEMYDILKPTQKPIILKKMP